MIETFSDKKKLIAGLYTEMLVEMLLKIVMKFPTINVLLINKKMRVLTFRCASTSVCNKEHQHRH